MSGSVGGANVMLGLSAVGSPPVTSSSHAPAKRSTTLVPPYSRDSSAPSTSVQNSLERTTSLTTRICVRATPGSGNSGASRSRHGSIMRRQDAELLGRGKHARLHDHSMSPEPQVLLEISGSLRRESADVLLVASPEHSSAKPGVLKNVLDWACRPAGRSLLSP